MTQFCLPAEITADRFLNEFWQKKPLLIRNGLPQIVGMFEPDDIIELSQQEEVTARLIKQYSENDWRLSCSPLTASDFKNLPEQWTVLVQNLEQWSPELGELWNLFGFIPQWQRDDIMVSYAPKGGSVGRHYDEYDVFLVQGYGQRRWQLGKWCDPSTEFKANQPIRIFDDMGELVLDEVLNPGDVLYVPSRLSHYGVAQNDCLTFSFGLRYPNLADLLEHINKGFCHPNPDIDLHQFNLPLRLSPQAQKTGKLAPEMVATMKAQLLDTLAQSESFDRLFQQAVATAVSSRRYDLLLSDEMAEPETIQQLFEQENAFLYQDNNCKLLYTENPLQIYANGEWLDELNPLEALILQRLADGERLYLNDFAALAEGLVSGDEYLQLLPDSICNWLDDGVALMNTDLAE